MFLKNIWANIVTLFAAYGGIGRFDSVDGTYDEQTGFSFEKTLYYQARTRSIIGKLSRPAGGSKAVVGGEAGGDQTLDGSSILRRVKISEGDMLRLTMQEHAAGLSTYGDSAIRRGDFLSYKNMEARVNAIGSPAIPVVGRMAQQRAKMSITNLPAAVREAVINYMEEQMEYEFLYSLPAGGSMSLMSSLANGGLALSLGVNTSGTAGRQLMPRHFWTKNDGYLGYSTTPATWNSTCNTALNEISADVGGILTLADLSIIRAKLDDLYFKGLRFGSSKYKAIAIVDSDTYYRINHLLKPYYRDSKPREGKNPIFDLQHTVEFEDVIYVNVPNLKKYRLSYSSANGYPTIGPGLTTDPRSYTPTSKLSTIYFLGMGAVVEGYNDSIKVEIEKGSFGQGMEVAAMMDLGYVRAEWFAKDARTSIDAVYNDSLFAATFYEPGVGQNWD
jgi:hypothetical protein